MCFSATASFATAGLTGAIGIISLTRVTKPRDILLAAVPCIFAVQQIAEGSLWLTVAVAETPIASGLTSSLPAFRGSLLACIRADGGSGARTAKRTQATDAALRGDRHRRRRLSPIEILAQSHAARLVDGHIVYVTEKKHSAAFGLAYLAATGLPLVLSSQRAVAALGVIVLIGCATAYALYWEALVSVWCFFAAAASVVIFFHFEAVRRHPLRVIAR